MISLKYAWHIRTLSMSILCAFANLALAADGGAIAALSTSILQASKQMTSTQLDEIAARSKLANSIVDRVTPDADSKGIEPTWQINLLGSLYNLSSTQLRNIEPNATTLDQAHALANAAKQGARVAGAVAKNLGSATDTLAFFPITPCRFIDTRVTGGAIKSTAFYDTSSNGSSYGGSSSCVLPNSSIGQYAFAANVTVVVGAGAPGYIGIRPYNSSNTTSFLNWSSAGAPSGLANAGIFTAAIDTNSPSQDPSSGDYVFEVFNGGTTSAQIIMDYFGYFGPATQAAAALDCVQPSTQYTINGGTIEYFASPACPSGYTEITAFCRTGGTSVFLTEFGADYCGFFNSDTTLHGVEVGEACCRVPAH